MISIIVPVYNVEPYLRKCLDSIIGQTYRDLEILVIDDGSTDQSGKICDEYAERDERIKVFHTENRGLSAARNLGLDEATGEWIGFVDSDDWIESDMYEVLLKKAEETGADVVECGWFKEWANITEEKRRYEQELSHLQAIEALVCSFFSDNVWNKLWRDHCFSTIRFPAGRVYEDIATTFRVFDAAEGICSVDDPMYHYRQRETSLSKKHELNDLIGLWLSQYERYRFIENTVDEPIRLIQMKYCAEAIARTWSNYCDCKCTDSSCTYLQEMSIFARDHLPLFGQKGWGIRLRLGVFFPHFYNGVSIRSAWFMNHIYKMSIAAFKRGNEEYDL